MTLPKITDVKLETIYGDVISAKVIPMSVKASMDIETYINIEKQLVSETRDKRYDTMYKNFSNQVDFEELKDLYIENKILYDLTNANESFDEKRIKSLKEKRGEKLLEGKTQEVLLKEITNINLDLLERTSILGKTVNRTLWHILRKPDNIKEHLFNNVDELEESLEQSVIISIFNQKTKEDTTSEEDLKNSQRPA